MMIKISVFLRMFGHIAKEREIEAVVETCTKSRCDIKKIKKILHDRIVRTIVKCKLIRPVNKQ